MLPGSRMDFGMLLYDWLPHGAYRSQVYRIRHMTKMALTKHQPLCWDGGMSFLHFKYLFQFLLLIAKNFYVLLHCLPLFFI
jgi:hypothetical protein